MKNIFYIESEKFLRDMIEAALKEEGFDCYTMEDAKDPFYLIKDLSTDLLFIDLPTLMADKDSFFAGLEAQELNSLPIIATGSKEDLEALGPFKDKVSHLLEKPLSASNFVNLLKSQS